MIVPARAAQSVASRVKEKDVCIRFLVIIEKKWKKASFLQKIEFYEKIIIWDIFLTDIFVYSITPRENKVEKYEVLTKNNEEKRKNYHTGNVYKMWQLNSQM